MSLSKIRCIRRYIQNKQDWINIHDSTYIVDENDKREIENYICNFLKFLHNEIKIIIKYYPKLYIAIYFMVLQIFYTKCHRVTQLIFFLF